ncbi:MAG TPA: Uma2 family endonuclease [Rugosimonospora sp.]|nr:Uma2 family endonuclease [Rugosimonospora sp.]
MAYAFELLASQVWTTDDLDTLPEDSPRRELIDGVPNVSPAPSRFHQSIAARLNSALLQSCPDDFDVSQGVEVRISKTRSFIPDVVVTRAKATFVHYAAPDEVVLAIEIVSPSSTLLDRVTKPAAYAQAGVPFYWRIETHDPGHVRVDTYALSESGAVYAPTGEFTDVIELDQPWRIRLPVADIVSPVYRTES